MPFGAAVALMTGQAGSRFLQHEWAASSAGTHADAAGECYTSPELDEHYPAEWRAEASIKMADGQVFRANIHHPLGESAEPLSWPQLEARFHELVAQ